MKSKLVITGLIALMLGVQAYAQGVERIAPPQQQLGTYVIDTGLSSDYFFRSNGPLVVQIPVPPVVNPDEIGPDGYLKNPAKLIANKVIGATATIEFPAFDINDKSSPPVSGAAPEKDVVTFNGKTYGSGVLSGFENQWVNQTIQVPIGELKFSGGPGGAISNELHIDIDVANANFTQNYCAQIPRTNPPVNHCSIGEVWGMTLDWIGVQFDVAAPYVLAHGINAQASTWDEATAPGVISTLDDIGVAWNRFSVAPNGSVDQNAVSLANQINVWLKTMQADRVHIIAHSKGGLDAQAMAADIQANSQSTDPNVPNFKILSLSTLSTPHYGSTISDVASLKTYAVDQIQNNSADPNGYINKLLNRTEMVDIVGAGPQPPGLWDLKTNATVSAIMEMKRGNISPIFSIGASADLDGNHKMNGSEADKILSISGRAAALVLDPSYQVNLNYLGTSLVKFIPTVVATPSPFIFASGIALVFSTTSATTPQENDIFVTETSANPSWATPLGNVMANHSTIKTGNNVRKLIEQTISLR